VLPSATTYEACQSLKSINLLFGAKTLIEPAGKGHKLTEW
jgi:hypothetical protein